MQGMSDLAVPMLLVFEDDAMAFWCFERLLQRVKKNFRHDESGIKYGRCPDLSASTPSVMHTAFGLLTDSVEESPERCSS